MSFSIPALPSHRTSVRRRLHYIVYEPNYNIPGESYWKHYSSGKPEVDARMLLSEFVTELYPDSEFLTGVLVPARDLKEPAFKYSRIYQTCSDAIHLREIMEQGGICLVFRSMVIPPS